MNRLAIIPARGGSKRIPRKNVKNFLGKPIIAYSIELALQCGLFSEVMVSTDDDEIASVARYYGATVPFIRSEDTADDFAPLQAVIDEVINFYRQRGKSFSAVCCLLPTAPFVTFEMLDIGLKVMEKHNFDSVRPIVKFSYPIQRALKLENGKVQMMSPEHALTRSQDLEDAFHDAGLFYWMKFEKGLKGDNKGGFPISEKAAQDIDTEEDWEMAELKFKLLKNV